MSRDKGSKPSAGFVGMRSPEQGEQFNVLDHADQLIGEAWAAEIPPFYPDSTHPNGLAFRDSTVVANSLKALAELVYFSK